MGLLPTEIVQKWAEKRDTLPIMAMNQNWTDILLSLFGVKKHFDRDATFMTIPFGAVNSHLQKLLSGYLFGQPGVEMLPDKSEIWCKQSGPASKMFTSQSYQIESWVRVRVFTAESTNVPWLMLFARFNISEDIKTKESQKCTIWKLKKILARNLLHDPGNKVTNFRIMCGMSKFSTWHNWNHQIQKSEIAYLSCVATGNWSLSKSTDDCECWLVSLPQKAKASYHQRPCWQFRPKSTFRSACRPMVLQNHPENTFSHN